MKSRLHHFKYGHTGQMKVAPTMVSIRNHLVLNDDRINKVRGVYAYPFDMWMLENIIYNDLIKTYNKMDTCYGINITPLTGKMHKMCTPGHKLGNDFSRFDKTVHPFLIKAAFKIINRNLDYGEYQIRGVPDHRAMRNIQRVIQDYFINTPLVLPNGEFFAKKSGIPSGSLLTNLIDSVVNALATVYCSKTLSAPIDLTRSKFFGDDSLIYAFPGTRLPSAEEYSDCFWQSFGLITSPTKAYECDDTSVEFVGFKLSDQSSHLDRPIIGLLASLIHPETTDRSTEDFYQRLIGISYCGAFNPTFRDMCWRIENFLLRYNRVNFEKFRFKRGISRMLRTMGVDYLENPRVCTREKYYDLMDRGCYHILARQ